MDLKDIALIINGEVPGNADVDIAGVAGVHDAKEGDITYLAGTKFLNALRNSKASAVIVNGLIEDIDKPQVIVKNPQFAFSLLLSHFYVKPHPCLGISSNAYVSEKAAIGKDVTVYPFACISDGASIGPGSIIHAGVFVGENSRIGEGSIVYPNVTIREGVNIGNKVIIHAGTVIGADGFGYVFENGIHNKIPQVGGVIIEDNVEIGANVTIDRATTGNTVIGEGSKIDNLVQVGHNVRVGRNVILVAQVGIGGSSILGDGVVMGGQAAVSDHTVIEAGSMFAARSGALGEVKRGIYSGAPIMPHRDWLRATAIFAKLPELHKKIKLLEDRIKQLEEGK